ncbi:ankyrin repeat domain-containing protein, partial [Aspergillus brunneoviolaceus CBS 621.78]
AAEHGQETIIKLLLATNRVDPEAQNSNRETPLWWAARNGHETIVTLLLTHGADPESRSLSGGTPLLWAARNGHAAIVKLLLQKGADPDGCPTEDGETPL